ncbi:MAG: V-type ATPase subunit [Clostridia bacterium]|nr:V-type ATPase subunit [Clostridia bacterium]
MNNDSVLFAYSRTKFHESKLIGAEKLNRIFSARSCEDALKVLYETIYSENAAITDCSKFALLTNGEQNKLISFFSEVCPDINVKACFLKQFDYHNAKVFVKAKYSRSEGFDNLAKAYGLIDIKELKESIKNENYSNLPILMGKALSAIDINYANYGINPRMLEIELDKALYAEIATCAAKTRFKFVKHYFILKTDIENLLTTVKCKILGLKTAHLGEQFLSGGSIELKEYASSMNANVANAAEPFKNTGIYELALNGFKNYNNDGITYFEREADKILTNYFYQMRGEIETVYPLLNYYLKKQAEIKNINFIFSARLGGADNEEIINRVTIL